MTAHPLLIRPSSEADLPTLARIYGHAVLHGTGTFELEAPDEAEMSRRRDAVLANGLPWLVAERDGLVLGYAYANHVRPRRNSPIPSKLRSTGAPPPMSASAAVTAVCSQLRSTA